jgi:hypothetical protein
MIGPRTTPGAARTRPRRERFAAAPGALTESPRPPTHPLPRPAPPAARALRRPVQRTGRRDRAARAGPPHRSHARAAARESWPRRSRRAQRAPARSVSQRGGPASARNGATAACRPGRRRRVAGSAPARDPGRSTAARRWRRPLQPSPSSRPAAGDRPRAHPPPAVSRSGGSPDPAGQRRCWRRRPRSRSVPAARGGARQPPAPAPPGPSRQARACASRQPSQRPRAPAARAANRRARPRASDPPRARRWVGPAPAA